MRFIKKKKKKTLVISEHEVCLSFKGEKKVLGLVRFSPLFALLLMFKCVCVGGGGGDLSRRGDSSVG